MECTPFHDADGDGPRSSHWEIWDAATNQPAWRGTGRGLELSHVHLNNGNFEGALRGKRFFEFDHPYRLRVRYRDDSGDPGTEYSEWSDWRRFRTATFGIPAMTTADVLGFTWLDEHDASIIAPGTVVGFSQIPSDEGEGFTLIHALDGTVTPPETFDLPPRDEARAIQLAIRNEADAPLEFDATRLDIELIDPVTGEPSNRMAYLPALQLDAGQLVKIWLGGNGATFAANSNQTEPAFSNPLRETEDAWIVPPGFVVEEALGGLEFPTQILFNPRPIDDDGPLYFVMELKGRILAVDRSGDQWVYAEDLVEFDSPAPTGNAGQVGLGGMAIDPSTGDMFVTRTYRALTPPISWTVTDTPPGLDVFLPSTASWSSSRRETKVVRYVEVPTDGTPWSFSARIRYPVIADRERWVAGMVFGLVAYNDVDNAYFATFESNRHRFEALVDDKISKDAEVTVQGGLAGWLRLSFDGTSLHAAYRRTADDTWQVYHEVEAPAFLPGRVGVNARNFFNLVGHASFVDIRFNDEPVDPNTLLDDTATVDNYWLHNQIVRLHTEDNGRTASELSVVFDMPDDISHESHQIQDIEVGVDGRLLVSVGDGFDAFSALDMETFLGKLLRVEQDGSAPADNPFYDPNAPTAPRSYIRNPGLRNTWGMALRRSDGRLFCSENGPSRDRVYTPAPGMDMGYDGTDNSMKTNALFTWAPAIAPVGIDIMQTGAFPGQFDDRIFVGSAGQDFTTGSSRGGKRIHYLTVDQNGQLVDGPEEFLRYEGSSRATVIGLAFGPDGLYFTTLYNTDPAESALENARVMRVRWVGEEG